MFQTWNDRQINRKKEYSFIKKLLSLASGLFGHNIRGSEINISDQVCRGEFVEIRWDFFTFEVKIWKVIDSVKSIFWVLLSFFKLSSQERRYCSFIEISFKALCLLLIVVILIVWDFEPSQPSRDDCFLYYPNNYWQILKKF